MADHFTLYDGAGKEYRAVRTHSRIRTTSISDLRPSSIEGLASVALSDGRQLTSAGGGNYRIVQTGEELFAVNPTHGFTGG